MANGTPIGEDFAWLDGVMARAIENITELTDWEADFASNMAIRLGRHGARTFVSGKQREAAERIERKLEGMR